MAPAAIFNGCVPGQLRQLIYYNLDNNQLQNALFFAERLAADAIILRDKEPAYLLALCHLRLGDNASACEYSKDGISSRSPHLGCSYVFAQACLAIDKHKEGINALEKCKSLWAGENYMWKHTEKSRPGAPDAAAVHCLLGKLYNGYNDPKKAISHFENALKLNPFMWDAFTSLCDMGIQLNVNNIFVLKPEMEAILKTSNPNQGNPQPTKDTTLSTMLDHVQNRPGVRPTSALEESISDPFNPPSSRGFANGIFSGFGNSQKINGGNSNFVSLPAAGGGGIGPEAMETPTGPSALIDANFVSTRRDPGVITAHSVEPPHAPLRKPRTLASGMDFRIEAPRMLQRVGKRLQGSSEPAEESAATQTLRSQPHSLLQTGDQRKRTVSGQVVQPPRQTSEEPQRRSARLMGGTRPGSSRSTVSIPAVTVGTPNRELKKTRTHAITKVSRPASTVGRQVSGNRVINRDEMMEIDQREQKEPVSKPVSLAGVALTSQKTADQTALKQEEGLKMLLEFLKLLGSGYFALSQFKSQDALDYYHAVPRKQKETPWVLAQMGRAHYEQANYNAAEAVYARIRLIAPTRFADMEIYSTILWHLKREADLSFLAHQLLDDNWMSPEAWCALGNAWSLNRDHEQALRAFDRATKLNDKFAYAFTLQGHEHVANEEYEKAQTSYRKAISADPRHYNAWYGIGRVFEKLGNYDKAFVHFTRASRINPTNAVLICCIGTVLEKQENPRQALSYFTEATELAPKSALTRFKKARALMTLGDLQSAHTELLVLKDLAPEEAMVHFLLGKLYKRLHKKQMAVKHFTISLNLDPKVSANTSIFTFLLTQYTRLVSRLKRLSKAWKTTMMMTMA